MKLIVSITFLSILACGTKNTLVSYDQDPSINLHGQEATVEAHVITRGKIQYILAVPSGENAGKYLPEVELAEEFCQDGLKVKVDAAILQKKGIVYKPGATDIPEKDFEVPMIKVLAIEKL